MKRTKRNHGAIFKAHVAAAASKGDKTLSELAVQCSVHPTSFFSTMGAFGSHEFIVNEHAVGQAKAEELLTFELRWKSSVFQHHAVLRDQV